MLHIHNGDSTAGTAKKSGIPGPHLAWREALVCGPAPGALSDDEFRSLRAGHLAAAYGVDLAKCENELREQEDALLQFPDHEEVVLWFEYDLFCQDQLIYLLDWFAQRKLGNTKLSLICIGGFPGIPDFRGLGQLDEGQLASLFPKRREITPAQLKLGSKAWRAYASSNPKEIESLLQSDLMELPFLKRALTKHLQRFPSVRNGLGRVENLALELVADGQHEFRLLFSEFGKREPEYGFGDSQVLLEMKRLVNASPPLLVMSNGAGVTNFTRTSFQITEHGQAVLRGDKDFTNLNGIDLWLGGVHLAGNEAAWRWDEAGQRLVMSDKL
jgi:hypothetical protein